MDGIQETYLMSNQSNTKQFSKSRVNITKPLRSHQEKSFQSITILFGIYTR
jgi:hypothetical protein